MVNVKFDYDVPAGVLVMDVKGHAAFAELGKDPVCAGASVLAMTVAQMVRNMQDEGKLQKKANIRIKNGRVTVICKPKQAHWTEALHTFYFGETGMHLLAESYPDHVSLTPFTLPDEGC